MSSGVCGGAGTWQASVHHDAMCWGPNLGPQAGWQVPLPTESSQQLSGFLVSLFVLRMMQLSELPLGISLPALTYLLHCCDSSMQVT